MTAGVVESRTCFLSVTYATLEKFFVEKTHVAHLNCSRERNTRHKPAFSMKNILTMKKTIISLAAILAAAALLFSSFSRKTTQPVVLGGASFEDFLKQFPTQTLPYALDEKTLQARLELEIVRQNDYENYVAPTRQRLSWEYFKFLPYLKESSMFSRNPVTAEPVAAFKTDQYHAVIYITGRGFSRNYGEYCVTVFNKKGKHIATNATGSVNPTTLISFDLDKNLRATTKTWQVNWEKNYDEHGLDDNKIASLALLETKSLDATQPPKTEDAEETPPAIEPAADTKEGTSK
jgi:hypothetical protein